ncbi:MAG: amino acid adenylation domain-containing protein [Acidobacteria bacterium]|nr:amino acid adenylation domain-containing protein [Acidobacteriota bacterium]
MSYAQQRLWFLAQMEPDSAFYNTHRVLRLRGRLRPAALARSFALVVRRHEILRTSFTILDGEPVQVVAPDLDLSLPAVDLELLPESARWTEARRLAREAARRTFDLALPPLLRIVLLRLAERDHVLLLNTHHIVSDAWSVGVLLQEVGAAYRSFCDGREPALPELPIQYADFAEWQRERLQGEVLEKQLAYWRERLGDGAAGLELPTDRPRPAAQTFRGAVHSVALRPPLAASLRRLARNQGATLFMTLLAGFQALLARYTGQRDVSVGIPVSGRTQVETEGLIGLFLNTLVARTDLSGDPHFAELLVRVRQVVLEAHAHQDLPFERLVEELRVKRDLSATPLFRVLFTLESTPKQALLLPDLSLDLLEVESGTAKFDLSFALVDDGERVLGGIEYNVDLFDAPTIVRFGEHCQNLLAGAADDVRLSELPVLGEAESQALLREHNDTAVGWEPELLDGPFASWARRSPDAVALIWGEERLTYGVLARLAGRVAGRLRSLGIGPEDRVGICVERSPEMVWGLLGVLQAGAAYVPLDPAYPADRLAFMLEDSGASVVLTQRSLRDRLPEGAGLAVLALDDVVAATAGSGSSPRPDPANLAYLIYTSGSTGRPKGVAIEHRSAALLVRWAGEVFTSEELAGVLASTSICFDLSVFEIFVPLAHGGTVILAQDALQLPSLPAAGQVRLVNTVPSAAAELVRSGGLPPSVRTVNLAGEPLGRRLASDLYAAGVVRVFDLYGPSEDTTYSTFALVPEEEDRPVLIGRPVAGSAAYVLDGSLRPVPLGVAGELCLGGRGLARGYLSRPELTAKRFVPDPWGGEPGARLYRTGDLARRLPDGSLGFLGRIDHQVKVRGFRIEPGEIELALESHPGVREAVVLATGSAASERSLAAWFVPDDGRVPSPSELREHLRRKLPEFMVPSAYVALEALPLTPNGKLDRRALEALEREWGDPEVPYAVPRTPVEEVLAALWADVLGVERVGAHDNFFDLGGHSLLAARLLSRVRESLRVELPMRGLFERPVLARFAGLVEAEMQAGRLPDAPPIGRRPAGEVPPLSFGQRRLWFLEQLGPGSPAYNIPLAVRLRGGLAPERLAGAFREVLRRHESLRTSFRDLAGEPVPVIAPEIPLPLGRVDLGGLPEQAREDEVARLAAEQARLPFDLARGPLLRILLARLGDGDHAVVFVAHHIVSDGWSVGVLLSELSALYAAFSAERPSPLPELPVQYGDFARWQRSWLQGALLEARIQYWRERLTGAPPVLPLPLDRPRPALSNPRGGRFSLSLPAALTAGLRALGRREGATLFMILMTTFKALLLRISGEPDLVVGTAVAGRDRLETEPLIGFLANTLALRTDLSGDPLFTEALRRVRGGVLEAHAHQDLPFEKLVEELRPERRLAHSALFQVMFLLQNVPPMTSGFGAVEITPIPASTGTERYDLTLGVAEEPDGLGLTLSFRRDLFDTPTAVRLLERFAIVLAGVAAGPDLRLPDLPLLAPAERWQLLGEWNDTAAPHPPVCLHVLFETQARRTPEAVAVSFDDEEMSYAELDRRAERLARRLRASGVGPERVVGVCLERSPELLVALLGVLKAGGAYLPLDPDSPRERLALMLADARPAVLLARRDRFPEPPPALPVLDPAEWDGGSAPAPAGAGADPANLAYTIYTSGSTGRPKGVMIPHGAIVNRLLWMQRRLPLGPDDRVLQKTPFSFDASVWELFLPLAVGARVVLAQPGGHQDSAYLVEAVVRHGVTVLQLVPSMLRVFLETAGVERCAPLRRVFAGGEALPGEVRERFHSLLGAELCNLYGPTEVSIDSSFWPAVPGERLAVAPIGRPLDNLRIFVTDPGLRPVPIGTPGELHVAGRGLARGYLGRPDLTAERFLPDPWSGEPGGRLYRTGDLVRHTADGILEFLGRTDHQVKIRGFRIEPGEIEAALAAHPGVRQCAVVTRDDARGDRRLVAYFVPESGTVATGALRDFLRERLPAHMVPAAFVPLAGLPVTSSGKLDRSFLPAPEPAGVEEEGYAAPAGPVEELLAGMWEDVLRVERVGRHDDFFDLGGHSLLATQLIARVRDALGVDVPLRGLFESPTVAGLAELVLARMGRGAGQGAGPIGRVPRDRPLPLSFAQERLWFLDRLEPDSAGYNLPAALRLVGPLARTALYAAVGEVVRRHEVLRMRFAETEQGVVQVPLPPGPFPFPAIDLTGLPDGAREAEVRRLAAAEAMRPFDLIHGPLLRVGLLHLGSAEHAILLSMHHIVSDGWSMTVLVEELVALYSAFAAGSPSPLPEPAIQYADFAAWQRRWLQGESLEAQLEYWKRQLAAAPAVLELPVDRPRPAFQISRGKSLPVHLPLGLSVRLRGLGRQWGATSFMLLMAGFQSLLRRYSGQHDLSVGLSIAGRTRLETERLIGLFVNTLVLRTDLSGDPAFTELVRRVREGVLEAHAHQDLPFEKLVEELQPERSLSFTPLFQVMFSLDQFPRREIALSGLRATAIAAPSTAVRFDLEITLEEREGAFAGMLRYATELFDESTILRFLIHFEAILEEMLEHRERRLSGLLLLSAAERHQLIREWNDTAVEGPRELPLQELFAAWAARSPEAPAVVCEGRCLSYGELDRRANRLARRLRRLGVGPEVPVALCAGRSLEMIVGMLAILKAGGAYLPLDESYPRERLALMVEDAQAPVLLAAGESAAAITAPTVVRLEAEASELAGEDDGPFDSGAGPDHLAYVIYTSGSTGRPKGVACCHRGVLNLLADLERRRPLVPGEACGLWTSISFDVSVWEIFAALCYGGVLHIPGEDERTSAAGLFPWLARHRIRSLYLPPFLLADYAGWLREGGDERRSLARLLVGVEPIPERVLASLQEAVPGLRIVNGYGPTEATVCATFFDVGRRPAPDRRAPLGRAVANCRVYLLDSHQREVPIGAPGEVWIGGVGLARGYFGRPDLTAERFLPEPIGGPGAGPGARCYRTGDLARRLPDGNLEFLGRRDHQVKLRGVRIELGEIEAVLGSHPGVGQAVAMVREDSSGERRLVAYVAPRPPASSAEADSRQVEHWESLYDAVYSRGDLLARDPWVNLSVWTTSYTDGPVPEDEIYECIEDSVSRILSLHPRRLWEIGCGTGLLLRRVAPHCAFFRGTDVSEEVLSRLSERLRGLPDLPPVELLHRAADDFRDLPPAVFDTVVMNEVTVHFPTVEYLVRVLEGVLSVTAPGGHIYLGGVRCLPLLEAFHASVALFQAADELTLPELREEVLRRKSHEKHMLFAPQLFNVLSARLPRIQRLSVQLKGGRHHSEITKFRYDVVLHLDAAASAQEERTLEWPAAGGALELLRGVLSEERPALLRVLGMPNARLRDDLFALRTMHEWDLGTVGELREAVRRRSGGPGVDPADLWDLGRELGYEVEVSWSENGDLGGIDALFLRPGVQPKPRTPAPEPQPAWSLFGNIPAASGGVPGRLVAELRAFLSERLPEPMMPSAFVILDELPRLPGGKIDRKSLPEPERRAAGGISALRTQMEEMLAALWAEVLQLERVGRDDNFFELGGHSLMATRLVSRIREAFGVELPLRVLFEAPTIGGLAARVEQEAAVGRGLAAPPLVPAPRDRELRLSFAQQRLWFIDQLDPGSPVYNIPTALRLRGPLDVAALATSFREVVRRHEGLRTTFPSVQGRAVQVIAPAAPVPLPVVDLEPLPRPIREEEVSRLAREEASRSFSLAAGPLLRTCLLRLGPEEHALLFTAHHIVSDGWSTDLLAFEVAVSYAAFLEGREPSLPELPVQYADFAHWQREWLRDEVLEQQLSYWRTRLAGAPPRLELPTDRPRPALVTHHGATVPFVLPPDLREALLRFGRAQGSTLYMSLLAGFFCLLSRHSGQRDLCVGSPIAGRNRLETENLIGLLVNMLVLRGDLSGNPKASELLQRVREAALEAQFHQDLPFEMLVDELQPERNLSHMPLFQVVFALQNTARKGRIELAGLRSSLLAVADGTAKFDLTLFVGEREHDLAGVVEYNTDLFDRSTVLRLIGHLRSVLEEMTSGGEVRLSELDLLSEAERHQMLAEWNDTRKPYARQASLQEGFERQATRHPQAVAVVFGDRVWTYGEVEAWANRMAGHLRELGVGRGDLVAVHLHRCAEMVPALLGILKSGAAYVPVEVSLPPARVGWLLSKLGTRCVITQSRRVGSLCEMDLPDLEHLVLVDEPEEVPESRMRVWGRSEWPAGLGDKPPVSCGAEDLAYIIFTSGSTGTPKGVMVRHQPVVNLIEWVNARFGMSPRDRGLFVTSLSFDLSVYDVFGLLAAGGSVRVVAEEELRDPAALVRALESEPITYWDSAPAALQQLVPFFSQAEGRSRLRLVFLSGDWVPLTLPDQVREAFPRAQVVALGGATEATVWSNFFPVAEVAPAWASIPYGRPIQNARYHVLDADLNPCPTGVPGDLYIGGECLALGYAQEPALTAWKFVPDGCRGDFGARLYRTGDRARYWASGLLEFLGRLDLQVKIRGFRIELGEIEAALGDHPGVREAVVLAREDAPGDKRLVAYVVSREGAGPDAGGLRAHLRERLPEYMVPSAFVFLDAMPVTSNGKLDRKALPAPERTRETAAEGYAAPRNSTEELLAGLWVEVLGVGRVGIHDNFFDLGGDSILSIQIVARANEAGLPLVPRQIFEHQTVAELAQIATAALAGAEVLVTGSVPLTPAQLRYLEEEPELEWGRAVLLEAPGGLDPEPLRRALDLLARRHDALRLRFESGEDGWRQRDGGVEGAVPLAVIDLHRLPGDLCNAALDAAAAQALASLDPIRGPLARAAVLDPGSGGPVRLLLVAHPLVVDELSWGLLLAELERDYERLLGGEAPPEPLRQTPFLRWAALLARRVRSEELRAEAEYWLAGDRRWVAPLPVETPWSEEPEPSARPLAVWLDAERTAALLQDALAAYHTRPEDLLLAALVEGFASWTGRRSLLVDLAGPGREGLLDGFDPSLTVGCFAGSAPLLLDLEGRRAPGDAIRSVKAQLRAMPHGGLGHGLLLQRTEDPDLLEDLRSLPAPEVGFRYMGPAEPPRMSSRVRPAGHQPSRAFRSAARHRIDVTARVLDGRLQVGWTDDGGALHGETVEDLARGFLTALENAVDHCLSPETSAVTPEDFELANVNQEQLDGILARLGNSRRPS